MSQRRIFIRTATDIHTRMVRNRFNDELSDVPIPRRMSPNLATLKRTSPAVGLLTLIFFEKITHNLLMYYIVRSHIFKRASIIYIRVECPYVQLCIEVHTDGFIIRLRNHRFLLRQFVISYRKSIISRDHLTRVCINRHAAID